MRILEAYKIAKRTSNVSTLIKSNKTGNYQAYNGEKNRKTKENKTKKTKAYYKQPKGKVQMRQTDEEDARREKSLALW